MTTKEEMEKAYSTSPYPWGQSNREEITLGLLKQYYNNGKIVEFGCSNGRLYTLLPEWLKKRYLGVDISDSIIGFCKRRLNEDRFVQGNLETDITRVIPGEAGAIICSDTIPYLSHGVSEEIQLQLFDTLAPGGIMLMSSWYSKQSGTKHVSPYSWGDIEGANILFTGESITRDKDGLFYNANWYLVGRDYALSNQA